MSVAQIGDYKIGRTNRPEQDLRYGCEGYGRDGGRGSVRGRETSLQRGQELLTLPGKNPTVRPLNMHVNTWSERRDRIILPGG